MVLVFHLCHLMMRLLLFPDSIESFKVFTRLHTYQTSKLIQSCAHLLEFEEWLCFIKAVEYNQHWQAKLLLELIKYKLDLCKPVDYLRAEKAVYKLIAEEEFEDSEMDGR